MNRRLLIPLMLAALACLGSECSGSSSSGANAQATEAAGATTRGDDTGNDGAAPVPEPSAALVFGSGLLVAGLVSRRKRR